MWLAEGRQKKEIAALAGVSRRVRLFYRYDIPVVG
jgi:DNA-binding CsgD family transcriptional regulator